MGDSHSIKEFRELAEQAEHADWMLKMIGSLSRDPSLQTEAKIEVLLRPVKGVASKRIPRGLPEKILRIGVGQLPMLRISSVWSNGQIHPKEVYPILGQGKVSDIDPGYWLSKNGVRLRRG